ncbi:MAG: hypothetical protein ACRDH2_08285 [Anaerolineales bacterium]
MNAALQDYVSAREALLAQIAGVLSLDERFVATWLTGSFGRNDADAVSDLDLTVVVADLYSEKLCARPWQVSARTTNERLDLFSKFGQPVVIHENNHNAPEGGTFTFVLYAESALMVDWTLRPRATAQRPTPARLLFDRVGIPLSPPMEPEILEQRIERASENIAFFWMMVAVIVKYIVRHDTVFVQYWLEALHTIVREVERLLEGAAWSYHRGSLSPLAVTREDQINTIRQLSERILKLTPAVAELGGHIPVSPMPAIEHLLNLADSR